MSILVSSHKTDFRLDLAIDLEMIASHSNRDNTVIYILVPVQSLAVFRNV